MVSAQLLGSQSLRDLESCYNVAGSTHYHLGTQGPRRSTLGDANRTRDAGFFKAVCGLLQGARCQVRRDLQAPLYLIDSSPTPPSQDRLRHGQSPTIGERTFCRLAATSAPCDRFSRTVVRKRGKARCFSG